MMAKLNECPNCGSPMRVTNVWDQGSVRKRRRKCTSCPVFVLSSERMISEESSDLFATCSNDLEKGPSSESNILLEPPEENGERQDYDGKKSGIGNYPDDSGSGARAEINDR